MLIQTLMCINVCTLKRLHSAQLTKMPPLPFFDCLFVCIIANFATLLLASYVDDHFILRVLHM